MNEKEFEQLKAEYRQFQRELYADMEKSLVHAIWAAIGCLVASGNGRSKEGLATNCVVRPFHAKFAPVPSAARFTDFRGKK